MQDAAHKIIAQGRRAIVFGLSWYTVDDDASPLKTGTSLAREIPGRHDLIVLRKEAPVQFGLARSEGGAKAGAISAASIVAEIVGLDSWIYVLEIERSIWICAGRDGYILASGDKVYDSKVEARAAYEALVPSSFKKVFLPASWKHEEKGRDTGTADAARDIEETSLVDFVEYSAPKWGKIHSLSPVGNILKIGGAIAVLGAAAAGAVAIMSIITAQPDVPTITPEQIEAARLRMLEEQNQDRAARWAQYDANKPWFLLPDGSVMLASCLAGIREMPANPVGYAMTAFYCDGVGIDASLQRDGGYSTWLEEWAAGLPDIDVTTSANGDQGFMSRDLPPIPGRGAQDLMQFSALARQMMQIGQIEGAQVDITAPTVTRIEEEPDYVPLYAKGSFSITSGRPDAWMEFFSKTPGLHITGVTFTTTDKLYKMEGEIYVPNT